MYVIVVYDISDVRKQARVRSFLKRFLIHVQFSVFEGELNPSHLVKIQQFLKHLSFEQGEGVLIYVLRDQSKVKRLVFGEKGEINEEFFFLE